MRPGGDEVSEIERGEPEVYDEFWGYVQIDLGCGCGDDRPVSADCLAMCAPGAPALCDKDWCACTCHQGDEEVDR
jgi:hypothetical protein